LPGNPVRLLRQSDEYGLRDLFRRLRISHLSQGHVIDHTGVPIHQSTEGILRLSTHVFPEQLPIIHISTLSSLNTGSLRKGDNYFSEMTDPPRSG
jgi:hypothetical protein